MANIKIIFKDGSVRDFPHEGRPGGSYTKSVSYEGAFVIVQDEYYKTTAFPMDTVAEVQSWPERW